MFSDNPSVEAPVASQAWEYFASELSVPFVGPSYKIAVSFGLLLLVLLLRPRGLFGKPIVAR